MFSVFCLLLGLVFSNWAVTAAMQEIDTGKPDELQKLGMVWNSATEFMLEVPSSSEPEIILAPKSAIVDSADMTLQLPTVLRDHTVFALTAFNPPGVTRSLSENTAANIHLWERLKTLSPKPSIFWRSFGVHTQEKWREDGFCLAYSTSSTNIQHARKAIIEVAKEFHQGAIYEYLPASSNEVVRLTVPAAAGDAVSGREVLVRVRQGPSLQGSLQRPWAGPPEWKP